MKALLHGLGTVVGLTVSESLNLCLLGNGRIETKRLMHEEDVVDLVVKERPILVSLSAPRVGDARVRENIETLAKGIRYRGLAVVGSDVRAADSILGRRRDAILDQLAAVSASADLPVEQHDSITAALAGVLFWAGSFDVIEAKEDYSIVVPSNDKTVDKWDDRAAIGLSGLIGSGKTTAGVHLQKRGFHYTRYSQVIEKIAKESGREPSRSTLQDLGREIHETRGQYWLGKQLLRSLPSSGCMVIDGLRYPEDHAFLTESFGPGFGHIAIITPAEARRRQFMESKPSEDYDRAINHQSERGVENVRSLAHRAVSNDGSKDEFLVKIDRAVAELLNQTGRVLGCH